MAISHACTWLNLTHARSDKPYFFSCRLYMMSAKRGQRVVLAMRAPRPRRQPNPAAGLAANRHAPQPRGAAPQPPQRGAWRRRAAKVRARRQSVGTPAAALLRASCVPPPRATAPPRQRMSRGRRVRRQDRPQGHLHRLSKPPNALNRIYESFRSLGLFRRPDRRMRQY